MWAKVGPGRLGASIGAKIGDTTRLQGWVHRLKVGDSSAMDELMRHFEERLIRLAHRMLGGFPTVRSVEQTDDVLQATSIRLVQAVKAVSPEKTDHLFRLAAMLIRQELIRLAQYHRRQKILISANGSGSDDSHFGYNTRSDQTDDPSQLAEWTEFHEKVAALPEEEREVFELIWYGGLSHEEAAENLDVCVRTIGRRWRSAQIKLHDALGGHLPGM